MSRPARTGASVSGMAVPEVVRYTTLRSERVFRVQSTLVKEVLRYVVVV